MKISWHESDVEIPSGALRIQEQGEGPALIVAVRNDPGHPLSTAEELAGRMPFAQLRVVESLAEVDEIHATTTHFLDEITSTGC